MKNEETHIPRIDSAEPPSDELINEVSANGIRTGIQIAMHVTAHALLDAAYLAPNRVAQDALREELIKQRKLHAGRGLKEASALVILDELLEAWEDERGRESCDCRPEPENAGHVCLFCRARTVLDK